MNALLGIAKVAKRYKRMRIVEWCAVKRHQQLQIEWKKATAETVTVDPLELTWE
jgi:hypothetical protein